MYTHPFLVWSNILWFLPAYIAYVQNAVLLSGAAFFTMCLSIVFHLKGSRTVEYIDTSFSITYLFAGPVLLLSAKVPLFQWVAIGLYTVCVLGVWVIARRAARGTHTRQYVWLHSMWHVMSALLAAAVYILHFSYL